MESYKDYRYKGLTPTLEGEHIGYALFRSECVTKEDNEVNPTFIWASLNKEPMIDYASIKYKEGKFFISKIFYTSLGNKLDIKREYFVLVNN